MIPTNDPQAIIRTARTFDATPAQVFAAFAQPELLAQWWGPNGFTNTFEVFEFRPGGRWVFVMHGPKGDYPNESVFHELVPNAKIVLEHIVAPVFYLTITLTPHGNQTHLDWVGEFETPELADKMRAFVTPANEQVLDRLQAVLAAKP